MPVAAATASTSPAVATQLKDLPLTELLNLAASFGVDPRPYENKPALVAAILDRRTMIAGLDRDALLDVLRWAGRPAAANATREHLAIEVVAVRSMRFAGLSHRGLVALAKLRGLDVSDATPTPELVERLKRQEGLFAKFARKRRALLGSMVTRVLGEPRADPIDTTAPAEARPDQARPNPERDLKREIEEVGLFAGLAGRAKRTADNYINQKLDEIEARIDRKLDEIDRRLAEWRDKEIANRLRILKLSLWATVIVGAVTLAITWLRVYFMSP